MAQPAGKTGREATAPNPVTSLWSFTSQFNNYRLANGRWNSNWQLRPVLPDRGDTVGM